MSDMEKAVEGGAEFMEKQAEHVKEVADAEAARRAALGPETYPREFDKHTHMVDSTNGREFTGTQFSYNTQAEALAAIEAARNNGKYVMYADPGSGSYINELSADDFRINVED